MYTILGNKKACAPCRALKEELDAKGIEYDYKDVMDRKTDEDVQKLVDTMFEAGCRKVPTLFSHGIYITTGKEEIKEILL